MGVINLATLPPLPYAATRATFSASYCGRRTPSAAFIVKSSVDPKPQSSGFGALDRKAFLLNPPAPTRDSICIQGCLAEEVVHQHFHVAGIRMQYRYKYYAQELG